MALRRRCGLHFSKCCSRSGARRALPFLAEWFGAFAAEGTAGGFAADDDADADEAAAAARQRQRQRAAEAAEHAAKEEKRGKELQWAAAAKGARVAQLKALVGRCTELTAAGRRGRHRRRR